MKLIDEVIFQFLLTAAKMVSELLDLHMGYLTYLMTSSFFFRHQHLFSRGVIPQKKIKKAVLGIVKTKLRKWLTC